MTDIVERLRLMRTVGGRDWACMDDAADEIEYLRQQLAECQEELKNKQWAADGFIAGYAEGQRKLAECQARRNQLLDVLYLHKNAGNPAYELMVEQVLKDRPDSTALETILKQAKREALLDASNHFDCGCVTGPDSDVRDYLRNKEEELK
jgi:hypothetical protein